MKWYIGQPIVAIENHSTGEYKKGDEFIIESLRVGCKHAPILIGIGHSGKTGCKKCGFIADGSPYCSSAFAPIDQDISELTEILTQKQPFEL